MTTKSEFYAINPVMTVLAKIFFSMYPDVIGIYFSGLKIGMS